MNYYIIIGTAVLKLAAANIAIAVSLIALNILVAITLFLYSISLRNIIAFFTIESIVLYGMMVRNSYQRWKNKLMLCSIFILIRSMKLIFTSFYFNALLTHFITMHLVILFIVSGLMAGDEYIIPGKLFIMCAMLSLVNSFELIVWSSDNPLFLSCTPFFSILLFLLFEEMLLIDSMHAIDVLNICLRVVGPFVAMAIVCAYPTLLYYIKL